MGYGTVGWLKKELERFPEEALWNVYFGHIVGININNPDTTKKGDGFIYCPEFSRDKETILLDD